MAQRVACLVASGAMTTIRAHPTAKSAAVSAEHQPVVRESSQPTAAVEARSITTGAPGTSTSRGGSPAS